MEDIMEELNKVTKRHKRVDARSTSAILKRDN